MVDKAFTVNKTLIFIFQLLCKNALTKLSILSNAPVEMVTLVTKTQERNANAAQDPILAKLKVLLGKYINLENQ